MGGPPEELSTRTLLRLEAKLKPGTIGGHYGGAGDSRPSPWRKPAPPTTDARGGRCRTQRLEQRKRGQTWVGSFRSVSFASQSGVQIRVRDGVWKGEASARIQ